MKKTVMCLVQNRNHAESIVKELQAAAYANDDISVLFPNVEVAKEFAHEHHTKAPEGALAIPGIGPFVAAGPLLAALGGAAAGAVGGGITGALIGFGIPEFEARRYEGRIKGGHLLISVHTLNDDQQLHVQALMRTSGAEDVYATLDPSGLRPSETPIIP